MSTLLEVTITRSQVARVGSLASHHTYFDAGGRYWECWAELETSPAIRGIGHVKRHPIPGSPAPADTWTVTAYLSQEPSPVPAKITEISLAFDPLAYAAHHPFVVVSVNAHEPRADHPERAWEFGDKIIPGIAH